MVRQQVRRKLPFSPAVIAEVRCLPLRGALESLGHFVRADADFKPTKDGRTERWIVSGKRCTFELIVTGVKWFDVRTKASGGGAVDLAMHVLGVGFSEAVCRLRLARHQGTSGTRADA